MRSSKMAAVEPGADGTGRDKGTEGKVEAEDTEAMSGKDGRIAA